MALKTKITAPGGFESADGYRRLLGIQVDFVSGVTLIPVGDYKDAEWRKEHPQGYAATSAYKLDVKEIPAEEGAIRGDDGKIKIIEIQGVPSGLQFLAQPIGKYIPTITPEMTLREVLTSITYGYAKTRTENAEALDI